MILISTRVPKLHKTGTQNKSEERKTHSNSIKRKAELHLHSSAALLLESVQKVVSVWTQVESVWTDGQPLQLSGGETVRPPLPSCLRRELSSGQHSGRGVCLCLCLCLSVRQHVWYSCVYVWTLCANVFACVCVLSRAGSSSHRSFRLPRLRRSAGLLGRGSHSAISRESGWSSPPAPRTRTEHRPWS